MQAINEKLENNIYENFYELQSDIYKFKDYFDSKTGKSAHAQKYF